MSKLQKLHDNVAIHDISWVQKGTNGLREFIYEEDLMEKKGESRGKKRSLER